MLSVMETAADLLWTSFPNSAVPTHAAVCQHQDPGDQTLPSGISRPHLLPHALCRPLGGRPGLLPGEISSGKERDGYPVGIPGSWGRRELGPQTHWIRARKELGNLGPGRGWDQGQDSWI